MTKTHLAEIIALIVAVMIIYCITATVISIFVITGLSALIIYLSINSLFRKRSNGIK